jgi:hypothetical protein
MMKIDWTVVIIAILLISCGFGLGWCSRPTPVPKDIIVHDSIPAYFPTVTGETKPKPTPLIDSSWVEELIKSKNDTIVLLAKENKILRQSKRDTIDTVIMVTVKQDSLTILMPTKLHIDLGCYPEKGIHQYAIKLDSIHVPYFYTKYVFTEESEGLISWRSVAILGIGIAGGALAITALGN